VNKTESRRQQAESSFTKGALKEMEDLIDGEIESNGERVKFS
jgi:hypothetical protein